MKLKQTDGHVLQISTLAVFLCLCGMLSCVYAEDGEVANLGEVVVTAKKQPISQVAAIDEVEQETMQSHGFNTLADVLQSLPGFSMTVGKRNEQTFTLRGFEQRQIAVLLDGIPLVNPVDGYVDSGSLPLDNLAKISVTKGPGSVLYGSNAMGGVVNIVTRRPQKTLEFQADAGIGERGCYSGHLQLGHRAKHYYLMMDYSETEQEDFRLPRSYSATKNEDGGVRHNSDRERTHLALKLGLLPAEGHEYAVGLNYLDSEWGMPVNEEGPARYWRFNKWRHVSWYLSGRSEVGKQGELQTRAFYDTFDNVLDSYDDSSLTVQDKRYAFHSTYDDYSYGGSLIYHPGISKYHDIGLSMHYRRDIHKSQADRDANWETSRSDLGSYAFEDNYFITETLSVVAGVSYDYQRPVTEASGFSRNTATAWNPMLGISWQITPRLRSWATVARKTRFPTLKELYSGIDNDRVLSNDQLREERSTSYETGLALHVGDASDARIVLFYSDIDDLIEEKAVSPDTNQIQNFGDARYMGFEFSLNTRLSSQHQLGLNYTYLDAKNKSAGRSSDHLPDRPKHKFHCDHIWDIQQYVHLITSVQWNGTRYYEEAPERWDKLEPFWLVSSRVNIEFGPHLQWQVGVRNILDEEYRLDPDYPQAGRTVYTRLTYRL
ncbi:MAG: TonB-dependent receptor [Desulfuromonadaceae bacterium]|nr:TonB-dependent receptor [Desulfuromonadaceae bacterium]